MKKKQRIEIGVAGGTIPDTPITLECSHCGHVKLVVMEQWGRTFHCDKCNTVLDFTDAGIAKSDILFKRSRIAIQNGNARSALIELFSSLEVSLREACRGVLSLLNVDKDVISFMLIDKKPDLKDYVSILNICLPKGETDWFRTQIKPQLIKKYGIFKNGKLNFYSKTAGLNDLRNEAIHNNYIPSVDEVIKYYDAVEQVQRGISDLLFFCINKYDESRIKQLYAEVERLEKMHEEGDKKSTER